MKGGGLRKAADSNPRLYFKIQKRALKTQEPWEEVLAREITKYKNELQEMKEIVVRSQMKENEDTNLKHQDSFSFDAKIPECYSIFASTIEPVGSSSHGEHDFLSLKQISIESKKHHIASPPRRHNLYSDRSQHHNLAMTTPP